MLFVLLDVRSPDGTTCFKDKRVKSAKGMCFARLHKQPTCTDAQINFGKKHSMSFNCYNSYNLLQKY